MEPETDKLHPEMNLFDALPAEAFKKMLAIAQRTTVEAGTILLRENGEGDSIRIILTGKVRVFKSGENSEEIELAILSSGSVFGEMGVFDGLPNSASVIALEETILLEIPRESLFQFLRENPEISLILMRTLIYILSSRLRKANVQSHTVASSSSALGNTLADLIN